MVIIKTCSNEHYEKMYQIHCEEMPENDKMSKSCFYDEFERDTRKYFVALLGDEVVGYIGVFDIIDDYNIIGIAVKKEYQNKKIGTQLIDKVIDEARKNGVKTLSLEVDSLNNKAVEFYKKKGFVVTNIRKNYYKNNDALIMWLYL